MTGKNLLTNICECGKELTAGDLNGSLTVCGIHGFYGGNVSHFAPLKCKKCGKEYLGYLNAADNTYKVIDVEEAEKTDEKPKTVKKKKTDVTP